MDHTARPGLPRELWLVVLGIFLNYVGYGAVLPFEVIYLHDGRGLSLGIAGLTVGLVTGVAVVTAPVSGPLIDRFGARTVALYAGLALAAGYAALAFARTPAQALAAAALAGVGNGGLNPSQSTLVATLSPPRLRHRATAVSRVAANVGAGIGAGVGGLVAAYGLPGFIALFLANGATYLGYVGVLLLLVRRDPPPEPMAGGYSVVLRDGVFIQLAATNVAVIAIGWGVFTWLLPPYARSGLGVGPQLIGVVLLANAFVVAAAQVPVARLAEGHRRMVLMATGAGLFVVACLLVAVADVGGGFAYPLVVAASMLVGVGECCHTTVLTPLVADLAPAALRGRYLAATGLSWWIGLALAPVLGAPMLGTAPVAIFLVAAAVALAAGVSALSLERRLPPGSRLTPRPVADGQRAR